MNEYQNSYPQYTYQQSYVNNKPVSVKEWVLTYFIMSIPIVGFIMLFVWAFGKNTKKSKANFCKAMLLIMLVFIILAFICFGIAIAMQVALSL